MYLLLNLHLITDNSCRLADDFHQLTSASFSRGQYLGKIIHILQSAAPAKIHEQLFCRAVHPDSIAQDPELLCNHLPLSKQYFQLLYAEVKSIFQGIPRAEKGGQHLDSLLKL